MSTSFLFDGQCRLLVSVEHDGSSIQNISFSPLDGDSFRREVMRWKKKGIERVYRGGLSFIPLDAKDAYHALKVWSKEREYKIVLFEKDQIPLAKRLLRYTFSPGEKMAFLDLLSHTPIAQMSVWQQALNR